MPNRIAPVEAILKSIRNGYPDGIETITKTLPVLFERIEELELALAPFARAALNAQDNNGLPMLTVYLEDCRKAFQALDRNQSLPATGPHIEYLPAE